VHRKDGNGSVVRHDILLVPVFVIAVTLSKPLLTVELQGNRIASSLPCGSKGRRIGVALGEGKAAILQNHGLLTVGALVAEPKLIYDETARMVRGQISGALPGWFQFRPLWDQITAEQPDLFD